MVKVNVNTTQIKDFYTSKVPINVKVTVDIVINYDDSYYLEIQNKEELLSLVQILSAVCGYVSELDSVIK